MPEVICLGEALIDFIALESGVGLMDVSGFKKNPGGAPANVAAALAKLGISSGFIGKVGDDPFGRFLARTLSDADVDTSHMLFHKDIRTGLAFVSLTAKGIPEFMFYRHPSADMLLGPDEIDAGFITSARAFHYGSITLISEPSKTATETAIEYAVNAGIFISYDPNLRKALWPDEKTARAQMLVAMVYPQLVKLNEEELEFLTGISGLENGATKLMSKYQNIHLLYVTLGDRGCYFRTDREQGIVPAFHVNVVDSTGAGDAFVAGTLTYLLERLQKPEQIENLLVDDLVRMGRFANAVAGITTTKRGAISALPTRSDVEELMRSQLV